MMQVRAHDEVAMIAVRHALVSAAFAVTVPALVLAARVRRRARRRIGGVDGELVLVDVTAVKIVQVAVVEIVGVALVLNGAMAAAGAVRVLVLAVRLAAHGGPPSVART
jgi:hypothetical protein